MPVNIEVIKERKRLYGDSFTPITEAWNQLGLGKFTPQSVSLMFYQMKLVRINATIDMVTNEKRNFESGKITLDEFIERLSKLSFALNDSVIDAENYKWISENFDEYSKL